MEKNANLNASYNLGFEINREFHSSNPELISFRVLVKAAVQEVLFSFIKQ